MLLTKSICIRNHRFYHSASLPENPAELSRQRQHVRRSTALPHVCEIVQNRTYPILFSSPRLCDSALNSLLFDFQLSTVNSLPR